MATLGQINYNEVSGSNDLIPAGLYQAIIIESGGKPDNPQTCEDGLVQSKSGKGRYLPMTFEIIEGDCKGRQLFKNFNLENVNETAVRIAQAEIKELLQALNWDLAAKPCGPSDTSELHMLPLTIKVAVRQDRQSGDDRNEIKKFMVRQSAAAIAATAPGATVAPGRAPWQKADAAK